MREIKFRAWSGNRMIDPVWAWNPAQNHFEHYNEFHNNWMYGLRTENVILMQFTGLRDKTGKKIYEGDVIEAMIIDHPSVGTMGEIVFDCDTGAYGNKNLAGITLLPHLRGIKVIGNIYENPELVN